MSINAIVQAAQANRQSIGDSLGGFADIIRAHQANKIAQGFMGLGDYSPGNIQSFFQQNKVAPSQQMALLQTLAAQDALRRQLNPMFKVNRFDPTTGTSMDQLVSEGALEQGVVTGQAAPEKIFMYNLETKQQEMFPVNQLPGPPWVDATQLRYITQREIADQNRASRGNIATQNNEARRQAAELKGGGKDSGLPSLNAPQGQEQSGPGMLRRAWERIKAAPENTVNAQFDALKNIDPSITWDQVQATAKKYGISESEVIGKILRGR